MNTSTSPVVQVSVHGPGGVLDLALPDSATFAEVAALYAARASLPAVLPLVTRSGQSLDPAAELGTTDLVPGSVLVAIQHGPGAPASGTRVAHQAAEASGIGAWASAAALAAAGAGWLATRMAYDDRWPAVAVLLLGAVLGCIPVGPRAPARALAAPAFGAAACFALAWDPLPERLPTTLGAAALAGAVTAAAARAVAPADSPAREGLWVWIVAGAGCFVVPALAALGHASDPVAWSVLFLLAVLAARFVPDAAIDVPDTYLLDLERLAVTAWSARERPRGRRGRIVVPENAMEEVAARGARTLAAAAVAILVVVGVTAPLLLARADLPVDRVGARVLLLLGGAALLFAARSYRHLVARRMLRLAGLLGVFTGAGAVLASSGDGTRTFVASAAIGVGFLLAGVAVLVGRGWRSAWWSRRGELAEGLCGAGAIGACLVATGVFRALWEITS